MSRGFPIGSDPNNFVIAVSSVLGVCLGLVSSFGAAAKTNEDRKDRLLQIEEERNSREIETLQILKSASKKSGDGGSKNSKLAGKTDC